MVKAAYSSVNFKDARVATGTFGIRSQFPRVPGIDVAGTVVVERGPALPDGDQVIATGYDLGVGRDGGFAEVVRLPGGLARAAASDAQRRSRR